MVAFGSRVKAVRLELGLGQMETVARLGAGFDQPRLSKIERGTLEASVEVIKKFATVFGRTCRELVQGTDREDYYFAQGLSADERAVERAEREQTTQTARTLNALKVLTLKIHYALVFDLFEAVYGGQFIAPQVSAEEGYVELRTHCEKLAQAVEAFEPGVRERLYFPDHIEQRSEMDMLLDDWKMGERAMVKESLAFLSSLAERYKSLIEPTMIDEVKTYFKIDEVAQRIAKLQADREKIEAAWCKKFLPPPTGSDSSK